jgi:hypothetical protein
MDPLWHLRESSFGDSAPMSLAMFGCLNGFCNPFSHYGGDVGPESYSGDLGMGSNLCKDHCTTAVATLVDMDREGGVPCESAN